MSEVIHTPLGDDEKATYDLAAAKWGKKAQSDQAVEEMGELIVALSHVWRRHKPLTTSSEEVAEEIADVVLVCRELMQIFDLENLVAVIMAEKLTRVRERLLHE